ncbi:MAG: ArsR/SmtB family transcription factor [Bacteroidota bacterium]
MNEAKFLARVLKILSVEARVQIVGLLKKRSMCVNALAEHLGMTQGAVSQHLRIMRDAGLLINDKQGYFVHYRLNDVTLEEWRIRVNRLLAPKQHPMDEHSCCQK